MHIKCECSQRSAGAFIQPGTSQFWPRGGKAVSGGWLGAEAGLEACPPHIVKEVGGSHSNVFNINSSVPQSDFKISANILLLS